MGNPRKPKSLHVLEGTFKKHRHDGREEIELPPGVPEKPDGLNKFGAAEWDRLVPLLMDYGVLSDVYGAALAVYCELYSEFKESRINPKLVFHAAKFTALRAAYTDLGLSPIARTKIPRAKSGPKKQNPFAPPQKSKNKRKTG